MVKDGKFMGTGVFIALRPDIFGHDNEHVTVEWVGHFPEWNTLIHRVAAWEEEFDLMNEVRVEVNGYANWMGKEDYHRVALVRFAGNPDLSFRKNWHITLESSKVPFEKADIVDEEVDRHRFSYCNLLWLGYKNANSEKRWLPVTADFTLEDMEKIYGRVEAVR